MCAHTHVCKGMTLASGAQLQPEAWWSHPRETPRAEVRVVRKDGRLLRAEQPQNRSAMEGPEWTPLSQVLRNNQEMVGCTGGEGACPVRHRPCGTWWGPLSDHQGALCPDDTGLALFSFPAPHFLLAFLSQPVTVSVMRLAP